MISDFYLQILSVIDKHLLASQCILSWKHTSIFTNKFLNLLSANVSTLSSFLEKQNCRNANIHWPLLSPPNPFHTPSPIRTYNASNLISFMSIISFNHLPSHASQIYPPQIPFPSTGKLLSIERGLEGGQWRRKGITS